MVSVFFYMKLLHVKSIICVGFAGFVCARSAWQRMISALPVLLVSEAAETVGVDVEKQGDAWRFSERS